MKDIWMYLLPSGFIASLLTWLVNRRRERLKDMREEHSVYRELYEDLRVLIKKQGVEHGKMRRKIYRLERILEEVSHCRHRHQCPLLRRLPIDENGIGQDGEPRDGEAPARGDPASGDGAAGDFGGCYP
ncbi:MAG: hypothetical protein ACRC26_00570 [Bacteroidales bacterium]